ncbi:hypothetical protein BJ742DRAFT_486754 [Cladochytrium replicatum]|nr:hypothetical protein BJ742DRAFT_486754 [Cladochytrium replicatum]
MKLIQWKLQKFGIWTFLVRGFLPMLAIFGLYPNLCSADSERNHWEQYCRTGSFLLGITLCSFLRSPRLIISNFYAYLNVAAIGLAVAMFAQITLDQVPPWAFLCCKFSNILGLSLYWSLRW